MKQAAAFVSWEEMPLFSSPTALIHNYYSITASLAPCSLGQKVNKESVLMFSLIYTHTHTHNCLVFHKVTLSHTAGKGPLKK